jgi:hypothetical protein
MHNVDEILFPKNITDSLKDSNILFSTNIDWDTDMASVHVSYFYLKEDKYLKNDNHISSKERLIGIGLCNKTGMINVCHFDGECHIYFWVKPEELSDNIETVKEEWEVEDVRLHVKAIKEKWTIERNSKKELSKKKSNLK